MQPNQELISSQTVSPKTCSLLPLIPINDLQYIPSRVTSIEVRNIYIPTHEAPAGIHMMVLLSLGGAVVLGAQDVMLGDDECARSHAVVIVVVRCRTSDTSNNKDNIIHIILC